MWHVTLKATHSSYTFTYILCRFLFNFHVFSWKVCTTPDGELEHLSPSNFYLIHLNSVFTFHLPPSGIEWASCIGQPTFTLFICLFEMSKSISRVLSTSKSLLLIQFFAEGCDSHGLIVSENFVGEAPRKCSAKSIGNSWSWSHPSEPHIVTGFARHNLRAASWSKAQECASANMSNSATFSALILALTILASAITFKWEHPKQFVTFNTTWGLSIFLEARRCRWSEVAPQIVLVPHQEWKYHVQMPETQPFHLEQVWSKQWILCKPWISYYAPTAKQVPPSLADSSDSSMLSWSHFCGV